MFEPLYSDVFAGPGQANLPPPIFIAMYLSLVICIAIEAIVDEMNEVP